MNRRDAESLDTYAGAFLRADELRAAELPNDEDPSTRPFLVTRVAWGIHASRGFGSPRQEWSEMGDPIRARLFLEARGAIAAYERYQREEGDG